MDTIEPRDRGEQIAVFRAGIIGTLVHAELRRGELKHRLRALSKQKFRPPGSDRTRTYGVSTLQRWYYAYKQGGLDALRPKPRVDRGHGRGLTDELKELLLDIRREFPHVPATVIRDTLILDGRMDAEMASVSTIHRLYREHELSRLRRGATAEDGAHRLRWEAAHPGALWHGDVCHGRALTIGDTSRPLRIHALMDDTSRYVVALEAHHTEREIDMLGHEGLDWEVDGVFLSARRVTVAHCLLDDPCVPWIEHEGRRIALRPVDPKHNGTRHRRPYKPTAETTDFDPTQALLDHTLGRRPKGE